MNNKGFTFIEILSVIVIIALITLIAIPTIRYADGKILESNYKTKVELIKTRAVEYGNDFEDVILFSDNIEFYEDEEGNTYPSITITVGDLLSNGYITSDTKEEDEVLDPRDNSSMLDKTITIYLKNNTAYAILNF